MAWEGTRQGDLVGDNRREVGIVYGGTLPGGLVFSGSITDPVRRWVLTVAPVSRHQGLAGTGAIVDNGASPTPAIQILDDHVTVEWLDIRGDGGAPAHGIEVANGLNPANLVVLRYNLIHDLGGDGIRLDDPDVIADVYGNVIYGEQHGIHLAVDPMPAARVNVFSNTIYGNIGPTGPPGHQVRRAPDQRSRRPAQQHRPLQRQRGPRRFPSSTGGGSATLPASRSPTAESSAPRSSWPTAPTCFHCPSRSRVSTACTWGRRRRFGA